MSIVLTLILIVAVIVAGLVWFAANTARKVEAAVPPCGQFMEIDGQRLHYIDTRGTGPAIVMMHGLGGTLWNYTYALVDKLSGEFRVIAVDRPGSGYSVRPDDAPAKLSAQADTLAKFMRALGLKQPLLVGHSLGGALSLAIALNHPDCAGADRAADPCAGRRAGTVPGPRRLLARAAQDHRLDARGPDGDPARAGVV